MNISNDLIGQRFGKLVVLRRTFNRYNATRWKCQCDCGTIVEIRGSYLRTGHSKSCGCWRSDWRKKRPYEWLYNRFVKGAQRVNREVSLTYDEFVEFTTLTKCHYCGTDIHWAKHETSEKKSDAYNLDRKNNDVGYTKDNCVVCCFLCNLIKGKTLSYNEMLLLGDSVSKIHQQRKTYDTNAS